MEWLSAIGPATELVRAAGRMLAPRERVVMKPVDGDAFRQMLEAKQARTEQMAEARADRMMQLNDYDRDGLLSKAETGLDEKAFNRIDRDGNGLLNRQELIAAYQKQQG